MAFNGSGTFLINTAGQPVVSGTVISSTAFNALTADLATGLSTAITKDGQTTVTANIPMSTYKFTGLGVGSAATDSANLSQVQSTVTKLLNSVSGADTITATASPTLAAYAAGQMFYFVAAGDNTTSVTLNIDSLGAKAVTRDGSVALAAADIKSGEVIVVVYDGTRFQVVSQLNSAGDARFANVSIASSLYVGGVSTFVGNAGFSANVSIASALSVGGVAAITGATTIGGNLTLSGGTANGVLYLNGSKVATSGSALTFDGTQLGVGTASPDYQLVVSKASDTYIKVANTAQSITAFYGASNTGGYIGTGTNHPVLFLVNGSEAMRLDSSGNLGIGTASPQAKLVVSNGGANGYELDPVNGFISAFNRSISAWTKITTRASSYTFNLNNSNDALNLDGSGNLGLGVTPSAWGSVFKAFEGGDSDSQEYVAFQTNANSMKIGTNHYYDGSNYVYKFTGTASRYDINSDSFIWNLAASGTAGNAISFTQAMTLDASGNLIVGGTSTAYGAANRVTMELTAATSVLYALRTSNTNRGYLFADSSTLGIEAETSCDLKLNAIGSKTIQLFTNNAERARITSGGDFIVGATSSVEGALFCTSFNGSAVPGVTIADTSAVATANMMFFHKSGAVRGSIQSTATATAYNTSSDRRLKDNIAPADDAGLVIDAIEVVKHDWKVGGHTRYGMIAQDLYMVAPEAVSVGDADDVEELKQPWGVDYSKLVPMLVKELQSLRKRVAELESK